MKAKGEKLQRKVDLLKEKLDKEKKANTVAVNKLNDSLDLIQKIESYIQQSTDVLNKAMLFDEGVAKNPVIATKVIPILVDFNQKMEEILLDMPSLFDRLKAQQLVPLDQMPNLSINTEELPTLQDWETRNEGQTLTPTKLTQPQASELTKEVGETPDESTHEPETQSEQDPVLMADTDPQSTPLE